MSQIVLKFIGADQVDDTKIRLRNNQYLRARNNAGSGDISVLKVNTSDKPEFGVVPQVTSDPSTGNDLARKSYVDSVSAITFGKESITLSGTNITNQYIDLLQVIKASSLDFMIDGLIMNEGVDYSVSLTGGTGGKTRVSFLGDLATGGNSALVATDVVYLKYNY